MVSPKNIPAFFERSAVTSALFPPFIVPSGFNGNLGICGADGARWELGWAGGGNPLGAELPLPTVPRGAVFAGSSSSSATTSDPCRAPGDASTPMSFSSNQRQRAGASSRVAGVFSLVFEESCVVGDRLGEI